MVKLDHQKIVAVMKIFAAYAKLTSMISKTIFHSVRLVKNRLNGIFLRCIKRG